MIKSYRRQRPKIIREIQNYLLLNLSIHSWESNAKGLYCHLTVVVYIDKYINCFITSKFICSWFVLPMSQDVNAGRKGGEGDTLYQIVVVHTSSRDQHVV